MTPLVMAGERAEGEMGFLLVHVYPLFTTLTKDNTGALGLPNTAKRLLSLTSDNDEAMVRLTGDELNCLWM